MKNVNLVITFCIALLIIILISFYSFSFFETNSDPDIVVNQAEFQLSDAATIPDNKLWHKVQLDDIWGKSRPGISGYAWYKTQFTIDSIPDEQWALYIPHINMNAEVYLNEKFLGSGGNMTSVVSRNWNRPQYFTIPETYLKQGLNELTLRLATIKEQGGFLSSLYIGDTENLRKRHDYQYHWQVTSAIGISVATLVAMLFFLVLWAYRRNDSFYKFSAITCFVWLFNLSRFYILDPPVNNALYFRLEHVSILWSTVCFFLLVSLYVFDKFSEYSKNIVYVSIGMSLVLMLIPSNYSHIPLTIVHLFCICLTFYIVYITFRFWLASRHYVDLSLSFSVILATALGMHDALGLAGFYENNYYHVMQYGPLFLLMALGWIVIHRFVNALSISENYNKHLSENIRKKHDELEKNYNKLKQLNDEKIINDERERVMQDIHDGVGAQLVSTLAMVESGNVNEQVISESLKDTINELRNIIDSLDPTANDVASVLAIIRERMQYKLEKANIKIHWLVGDIDSFPCLSPEKSLHILHIFQEAISNILKHASANNIYISTGIVTDTFGTDKPAVIISDDGVGYDKWNNQGRGINNMFARAEKIKAAISIENTSQGTDVKLMF